MKLVIAFVLLIVGVNVAYHYAGCYVLGGIEAGMPGGGHGKFKEYHEGNLVTKYFQSQSSATQGSVSANPYATTK